jgi:hypothetical protein
MTSAIQRRFWAKVQPTGDGSIQYCWQWTAAIQNGYGRFNSGSGTVPSHLFAWRQFRGDIPSGLVADHRCRNRACVNPWHLELVTRGVNVLRGKRYGFLDHYQPKATACVRGHALVGHNVYTSAGGRTCRTCRNDAQRRRRATAD